MKKSLFLIFIASIFFIHSGYGQYPIKTAEDLNAYSNIPKEIVYVHYNDNFLLAGEYLYYKLYCLNEENNTPSPISKMAYVELVGKDKRPIFKHKVRLISGVGQGDFFIPTTIPSGNYKLIGYTGWMRNVGPNLFFQSDITIINPYQELEDSPQLNREEQQSPQKVISRNSINSSIHQKNTGFFKVDMPTRKYGKRKPVSINFKSLQGSKGRGNYSISVRKKNSTELIPRQTTHNFLSNFPSNPVTNPIALYDTIYLPELRGELISGKVISIVDNLPIANEKVSISIPEDSPILKIANTNDDGIFYFSLNEHRRTTNFAIQLLGDNMDQKQIVLNGPQPLDYGSLSFEEFNISAEMNSMILKRSIYSQIENAYFEKKADSAIYFHSVVPIYNDLPETYLLEDYKSFPTLKETIVEIIDNVWLKKVKGKYIFQVRGNDSFFIESEDLPLVLVDGILVQRFNDLLDYNVNEIKKISLSRQKYYIGPQLFHGIISIVTKNRDNLSQMSGNYINELEISSPLPVKNYYFEDYDAELIEKTKRLPDFRTQLLWKPDFELHDGETSLLFYTSDVGGSYEICLEGFTLNGAAVSILEFIDVE